MRQLPFIFVQTAFIGVANSRLAMAIPRLPEAFA
jgi:hypothetical protein